MNLFALSGLLTGIACTVMAGLVYFTTRPTRLTRLWAFCCLAVSVWGFGALLIGLAPDPQTALLWWRITYLGVILIPVLFYHFVTLFARIKRPKTLAFAYLAGTVFLLVDATPLLIADVRKVFGQFYFDSPGVLFAPFLLFFLGMVTLSHVELWQSLRHTREPAQRVLIRWLLVGTAIGFAGGVTCFLPVFGIDLYPYGNFAILCFPLIMTYAFLRYRLIDVNLAVVRGVTFLALYALVVGLPFVSGYYYQDVWRAVLGQWWWVAPAVLMGLLASASPVLFLFLSRRLEQKLWKAQRRYHRTLITASSGMTRIKDIKRLCRLIVYVVNRTVGLANSGLFLLYPKQERYELIAVRYKGLFPHDLAVPQTDPVIEVITQKKDLLVLEELQQALATGKIAGLPASPARRSLSPGRALHSGQAGDWARKLEAAYTWMRKLEAKLIVPSFTNERLLAFLVLGEKRTGEPYTTDDVAIFSGLANQAALGIENALFFDELKTSEAYMIQSEKLASLGQLASGMAHEIHNPLTIISGESQLYLEQYKGKDQQVDGLLASIIEECHRAADITRRILRFAKPAPSELAEVDLRAVVEESLQLAGYQARLERVERVVELPEDLPKVRGNQNQLQEVLLNLILNACQAMGEQGGKLRVAAATRGEQIALWVTDTGPGIPHAKLSKIFDPFYTTKQNGTGLGLFVSQRIVRAHGGSIEVQSTEGQGTTFTITLPVHKARQALAGASSSAVSSPSKL